MRKENRKRLAKKINNQSRCSHSGHGTHTFNGVEIGEYSECLDCGREIRCSPEDMIIG